MLKKTVSAILVTLALHLSASFAAETFYTVQIGSFRGQRPAETLFKSIIRNTDRMMLNHLRIEIVKGYYVVRLGKEKRYKDAVRIARAMKRQYPGSVVLRAYYLKERIINEYNSEGKAAEKDATEDTRTGPLKEVKRAELEGIIRKISSMVQEGMYEEAMGVIEEALKKWPEAGRLYGWKATVLLKQGKTDQAIDIFKRAIAISPNRAEYHNGLGYGFLYKKEYVQALKEFDKALIINPEYVDALAGLGLTYVELGYKEHAMETYRKLKGIDEKAAKKLFQIIIMRL
ncbi:MAG TPA: tetratricopeptide repeat protein [Nitrospirae bacterium]|nr:tetratricopeptide repeat protein [Nitrospirota bacterium]